MLFSNLWRLRTFKRLLQFSALHITLRHLLKKAVHFIWLEPTVVLIIECYLTQLIYYAHTFLVPCIFRSINLLMANQEMHQQTA